MTGLDFYEPMLDRARRKDPAIEWMHGDLLQLPFPQASFDAATVGFARATSPTSRQVLESSPAC